MKEYGPVEFLTEVLSIKSVNGVDDEGEVARFLCEYLKSCGVDAMVQTIDQKHANVIAVLAGQTEEKVVWNGHLDTVPYGRMSEWNTDPAVPVKRNGCIYARGASDMKSGLAAMAYAMGHMKKRGMVPKQTIYFIGTCDEEATGIGAQHIIKEHFLESASLLLVGEPTGCALGVAGKGCLWIKLKVQGVTSHGAYPAEGINAVEYAIRAATEIKKYVEDITHPFLGNATAQITVIKGGIVPNMTPDAAELTMDIRTVPGNGSDEILQKVYEICGALTAETEEKVKIDISIENNRAPIEIDSENTWLKKMGWELEVEGLKKKRTGINYFTDASIFVKAIPELPVILFGPGEALLAHKPNEYVEIEQYKKYIHILSRLFL